MEVEVWQLWMIVAAIFVIGEMLTAGFFLFWFGVGAIVAGALAFLGFGSGVQWAGFIGVSILLFALSRRFAEKFTQEQPPGIGADRLIGKTGIVLEDIDNLKNTGKVRIDKDEWRADSSTGEVIGKDKRVKVVRLEGTHVVVEAIKEG